MPKLKALFNRPTPKIHPKAHKKFAFVILLGTITACSSVSHHRDSLVKILDQQNTVIEKLQNERNAPEVSQKVQKDMKLSMAEDHLTDALNALKKSNELVKTQIEKH